MTNPQRHLATAWTAYRRNDQAAMLTAAGNLVKHHPRHGEAWFWAGCLRERLGDLMGADNAFRRAARAPDEPVGMPFRCHWRTFQRAVDAASAAIPAFAELSIELGDYAEPWQLDGIDEPELLGLFSGPAKGEEAAPGELSPRIHLWKRAHEHSVGDARAFTAEVRTTLFHEFGHYLGYDEDDLEKIGLG
jgi:predicted Zn-dependent protease with MMP-like domain